MLAWLLQENGLLGTDERLSWPGAEISLGDRARNWLDPFKGRANAGLLGVVDSLGEASFKEGESVLKAELEHAILSGPLSSSSFLCFEMFQLVDGRDRW